ncbi:MAG: SDR family NAD(P)-dependent oxidoreductase [Gammaproteobacteria bacterium]|nr:SDR family NAD(P)-dependent oxidoreductase [Gammaproteobacteria bacterium]MBT4381835.1 SDR family NAD(P)-dependent oxidoreductase [Gammaproteobacteria bacterium]MBT4618153.1 SDR family NAD(P)-dependent oxidoreductase [Gammaproteobacteria bacterium]MBT5196344.1 SDR family NAD(P)-dependent oxidoreductase [Gammaproteobacteria bacterium]MBT5441909.1 SDR family NAD(P)-dependent oxidoreductase [Gammaproteobacteria bacterium]
MILFTTTQAQRRGGGIIINTASTASLAPMPADPMYSGTKTAVVNLLMESRPK